MNTLIWFTTMVLLGGITHLPPMVNDQTFELPIVADSAALANSQIHLRDSRLVVFLPRVKGDSRKGEFTQGPIKRYQVNAIDTGLTISLWPRISMAQALKSLTLVTEPEMAVRVGPPLAVLHGVEKTTLAPVAAHEIDHEEPINEVASTLPAPQPEVAQPHRPVQAEVKKSPQPKPTLWADNSAMQEEPARTSPGWVLAAALAGALVALLGVALWHWQKRGGFVASKVSGGGIQLIAIRAIGSNQRLAVVETSGERFLLAVNDKEVNLLKHLNSAPNEANKANAAELAPPVFTHAELTGQPADFVTALASAHQLNHAHPLPPDRAAQEPAAERLVDPLKNRSADRVPERPTTNPLDKPVDWPVDWQMDWQVGRPQQERSTHASDDVNELSLESKDVQGLLRLRDNPKHENA